MNIIQLYDHFLTTAGVFTDTRTPVNDGLYFALSGPRFNANSFALEALEKGAKLAVVDDPTIAHQHPKLLWVENTLRTLQELAQHHRQHIKATIVGLTGSNGKTTSKELITSVLKTHYTVSATKGNLNNHIGVPLTLLRIPENAQIAIVEMGANHQGEIAALSEIAQPDIGYITNFGKAHMEGFGGVEGIIKGKSELYKYLEKNHRIALCNSDDPIQMERTQNIHRILFGTTKAAEYTMQYHSSNQGLWITTKLGKVESQLYGDYNLPNIAAAVALGLHFNVPFTKIQAGIASYQSTNNRSQTLTFGDTKVILDAYNANPTSMALALQTFFDQNTTKRVLILGDMLELGKYSADEHQAIVGILEKQKFDKAFLVGKAFSQTTSSITAIERFTTTEDLISTLKKEDVTNKNLLLKGSRGLALEKVLEIFKE